MKNQIVIATSNVKKLTEIQSILDDMNLEIFPQSHFKIDATEEPLKNNEKLLKSLENESNRKAHYICVIVFVKHEFDPEPIIAEGIWHGEILKSPRGSGGFGYDPLFLDHMTEKAVAELPSDIKNRISHRGQALHKLKLKLNQIYG